MAQQYQLKGLTTLDLMNGEIREVDVEGVEEGKVLLVRHGDKTHALSSKCTHYGAPLKLGVLTPDGRLTCAWHGACFNVATGDVEDAPALDPIAKFEIVEKSGSVFIKADEASIKANRRSPDAKCSVQGQEKVVVVGGGSGAMGAAQSLREQGFNGSITIISAEPYPPIDRTKLSKALIQDASNILLRPQAWFNEASINLIEAEVSSVDFSKKLVFASSGRSFSYTKLILATGGTPKALPLPGFKDLKNIFLLRTIPDVQAILSAVGQAKGKKVVVIGSSFIGMEVGNCLASQKGQSVTVVGMEKAPLERVMGAEVGRIFQSVLEKAGVKFYMEASVDKAVASKSDPSHVGAVHLKDGTVLEADLVILGVGVSPATKFLSSIKELKLEEDGSLRTDESFAVQGLQDVYAVGDIATYPYHGPTGNGTPTRIEHWNVAQNAGRSVGFSIAHPGSKPKSFIPIFWSALGSQLRYCGNTVNGWDELILKGTPEDARFVAYYAKGEEIAAVASMQMDPVMSMCAELMRRGKMPSKSELKKGINPLDVSLPSEIKI